MKITLKTTGKQSNIILFFDAENGLQVPAVWKDKNPELNAFLEKYIQHPSIKVEKPSVYLVTGPQLETILLCSYMEKGATDHAKYRLLGGQIGKKLGEFHSEKADMLFPASMDHPVVLQSSAIIEGMLLGKYKFNQFKSEDEDKDRKVLKELICVGPLEGERESIEKAVVFAESTNMVRDWGNMPGNEMTPTKFKEFSSAIAKESGLKAKSLDEKQMIAKKFGCLMGVSKGSDEPAFLNILEYKSGKKDAETIMLVGKGLTFDSGGISLKPGAGMEEMKFDMCGGAAVLGAMRMVGLLKPDVNVIGLIPASENMPNGKANKPGDILTAFNGKTVEVINTDAEGRLILADALAYGIQTYKPKKVIDIATLTGACMIALGSYHSGLMSNNQELSDDLQSLGNELDDTVWPLPITGEYNKQLESPYADLQNVGGREAGAITAALFLKNFVEETDWAHLDIAGTAWNVAHVPFHPAKGATGAGARLMAEYCLSRK